MFRTEDGAIVGSIDVSALTDDEKRELGLALDDDQPEAEPEPEDLSKLHKAELVELAEAAGIDAEGKTKAELLTELEAG